MKGSRRAVLFLGDGSDEFGESTLPVSIQTQTHIFQAWFPLSSRENALGDRRHLFEPKASCADFSPSLAFFRKLRGTARKIQASEAER